MEQKQTDGYIYVIWNEVYQYYGDNVYKVGRSVDVENRARSYSTYYINECEVKFKSDKISNHESIEKAVHSELSAYRLKSNREFFKCELSLIVDTITNVINENSQINTSLSLYAANLFIEVLGTKCKKHAGILYFFDTDTGLWERDYNTHDVYFKNVTRHKDRLVFTRIDEDGNEKKYNYGGIAENAMSMLRYIEENVKETYFLKDLDSSIGKLLFSDGIYDFKTNVFTLGFDETILFMHRINRPFPTERNEKNIAYMYHILFQKPFDKNNETVKAGDLLLQSITRGLYGDREVKQFTFSVGNSNSGKGMLMQTLKAAFGRYISEFNGNQLVVKSNNTDLNWLLDLKGTRIAFSDGYNMSPKGIDGNIIKNITSDINCRTSFFFLCEDMPKISPLDTELESRVNVVNYTREFVEYKKCVLKEDGSVDESSNISLEDPSIKYRLKNEVALHDALFHLIVDTFQKM